MISIILVTITKGEITTKDHLLGLVENVFQNRLAQPRAQSANSYINEMARAIAYSCSPRPASEAYFLWISPQEFEIVIETFYQGNLIYSTETIIKALKRRLKQADITCKYEIRLQEIADGRTYISGKPISQFIFLWEGIKEHIVSVFIAIILTIVAKIWLTNYFEEALAGVIGLLLFAAWKFLAILFDIRNKSIDWRIDD